MYVSKRLLSLFAMALIPVWGYGAWTPIVVEPGKRIEIDIEGSTLSGTEAIGTGRVILDKPVLDPKTGEYYRIIEIENRFDCADRTFATLKRSYFREDGDLLRREEIESPPELQVRAGTPDDKFLREICRPPPKKSSPENVQAGAKPTEQDINSTVNRVNEIASDLRKYNDMLVQGAVKKETRSPSPSKSSVVSPSTVSRGSTPPPVRKKTTQNKPVEPVISWSYGGKGAPEHWGSLKKEYATCATGRFQSPIDLKEGIAVDLEPLAFSYPPLPFKVVDGKNNLWVGMYGGEMTLSGKQFTLSQIVFRHPSETLINGKSYVMEAQLLHHSTQGMQAIVSVLFEVGEENAAIQSILNHLPLKRGGEEDVRQGQIDLAKLLPTEKGYFTYLGSLTTPPCTEGVQWVVFETPQQISGEQLAVFQRLHPPSARPVQPAHDRIIKRSRKP